MPTQTLELYDGLTTLDLIDETNYATQYTPGLGIPRAPHVPTISGDTLSAIEFKPRTVSMVVDVLGTTQADMTSNIAALERMVAIAQNRQITQQGTKVVLKVQQGTTAANDVSYTVLNGSLSLDESAIRSVSIAGLRTRATLTLLVEPFGKLPAVTLATKTLFNEQDGFNWNYTDIGVASAWGTFYDFDGVAGASGSHVDIPANAHMNNIWDGGGTVSFRYRDDGPGAIASSYFVSKLENVGGTAWTGWGIIRTGGTPPNARLQFVIGFTNFAQWRGPEDAFTGDGSWYTISVEYNSSAVGNSPTFNVTPDSTGVTATWTIANGLLIRDTLPSGTRLDDSGVATVIANRVSMTLPLLGGIDEMRWYDAGSITDTITAELVGDETSLKAYFQFNEATGTNLVSLGSMGAGAVGTLTTGLGQWADTMIAIAGNAGGLLQVRIEDECTVDWNASKTMYLATRSGERRFDTLFYDVPNGITNVDAAILAGAETSTIGTTGGPTSNASGGTSAYFRTTANATSALQTGFLIRGYFDYQFTTTLPRGLFRVLARCQVLETAGNATISTAGIFGFALGYDFGSVTSTPVEADRVAISAFSQWELLDLGEINIAPIATPTGFTDPTLSIRVNACLNLTGAHNMANTEYLEWSCDHIFLLPIDEGAVIVNSVAFDTEVLADLISDPPGVWLLETNSVTRKVADFHGAPIRLSPEATRLYWMRDDVLDPSTRKAYVYISYVPLVSGI